ncbi:MAG: prepilin-type N-terminal cleavage/methylation domain-containing protein [Elusimicrobiaceae bacterium]|nr:prepilin-type N-terminal cleavage/methylation domain-containing protein [Elusimicrobiaceae bacterium]
MNNSYTSASGRGFTLIELLVVVLIIGILSAVALPQYTKAVEKARLSEALSNIKTMQDNIDLYLLENGGFPSGSVKYKDLANATELSGGSFDNDGEFYYETKNFIYSGSCWSIACDIQADKNTDSANWYTLYSSRDDQGWRHQCITQLNDFGRQICKSLQGQGWTYSDGEI